MKGTILTAFAATWLLTASAQVSISNPVSTPDPSAMLEVKSTNRGFLMPRIANRTNVATPAAGLMIYETATNSILVYSGSSWIQLSAGTTSPWLVNGTHIYNGNTGNVGIGITAPAAKLHLNGLFKIDGGQIDIDDNLAQVRLLYNTSPKGYFKLGGSSGNIGIGTYVGANDDGKLQLETKSFPRLTILPDGNVGIGHINPSEKLYVNGNIRTTARVDAEGVIEGAGLSSTGTLYVNGTALLGGNLTASSAATVYGNITTNTGITINDAAGTLGFKTGGDDKGFVQLSGDNLRVGTYSGNATGKFVVRTGGADQVQVNNSGNVGIGLGAATPAGKLHVAGKIIADADGETIKVDGVNPTINFYNNGTFRSFITQDNPATGHELYIGANGTLRLDATTQVAIGSVVSAANANYKLAIDGKVVCEELKVKLSQNWPDYVFRTDYKLMTLSQLNNFIKQNNHLPNIPSAAEVETEGITVGDMQKRLMEKVEELTLYILHLQKQLDELKAAPKNAAL